LVIPLSKVSKARLEASGSFYHCTNTTRAQIPCSHLQGIMLAFGIIILGKSSTPRLTLLLRSPAQEIDQATHLFSYFCKQLALFHMFGAKMPR
jgi:hypothetical protein